MSLLAYAKEELQICSVLVLIFEETASDLIGLAFEFEQ